MNQRDTFVVFHVTEEQARIIRKTIHAQQWYDGMDIPVSRHEKTLRGTGIAMSEVNDTLEKVFDRVADVARRRRHVEP